MATKILVIDDEADMLDLVKHTLSKAGFEVHVCDDGRAAWDVLAEVKPDVVILDLLLPGIDGFSLQKRMSEDPSTKDTPIVILTALDTTKTLFQKFPQVVGFITKPFKNEEMLKIVQNAVQHRVGS